MWIHLVSLELIDGAGGDPGATYTLSADGGAFSYSGNSANIPFNRVLPAEAGAFSYAGGDASLLVNRTLAANTGSFTYSGNDAALTYTPAANREMTAETGVYTFIGGDALLRYSGGSDVPGIDVGYGSTSTRTPKWWAKSGQEDEPEAVEAPKPKREPKKAAKAQEQAKAVIEAVARDQAARGDVPKSARFAEVRSQIKPLGSEATGFNWPALYERLYAQALTDAIRQEMAVADQIRQRQLRHEEETLLLLLAEA
jgi:hypothetical protein